MSNRQTFDCFLTDEDNVEALLLCRDNHVSVCLYGPSGCGKTHLLRSVEHAAKENGKAVCYVTAQQLMAELVDCIDRRADLTDRYNDMDVLLIDDTQSLIGRTATIEEVRRMLLRLRRNGCRVVLACECESETESPFALSLSPLVLDGVTAALPHPQRSLCRDFLICESKVLGLELSEEVVEHIISVRRMDFPTLTGILKKMYLSMDVDGLPIDRAWCDRYVKESGV